MTANNRLIALVFSFLFISSIGISQNFDPIDFPFEVDDEVRQNALIGGLIAPQFSSFDLDGQGAEDLIVFDRNGNVLLPFINNSTPGNPDYRYAPEYTSDFPQVQNFVQFHDFDGDGDKDLFTLSPAVSGVEVWRNTSEGNNAAFELIEFNFGLGNILQIPSGNFFTQIYVSSIDVPAIVDVDNDGDLDVLTFEPGGSYMYYYKNVVVEMGLPADTLAFRLEDQCWGKFFESGVDEAISLSTNPSQCSAGLKDDKSDDAGFRHSGSTVLAMDGDGDGDYDMLLGDLSNNGLVYLVNGGNATSAFMTDQNIKYPTSANEVDIFVHIAPYFIDVDNDGKRDLIAAQNNNNGAQNVNHIWYYKNIGTDDVPVFDLVQKDFLHNSSLIMGSGSHPTFLDYNADGLVDILVGTHRMVFSSNEEKKSLFLYENIGTKSNPAYKLATDDFLNMSEIVGDFDGYLAPTVGDLDSDGDDDIIIADKRGYLYYWENLAGADNAYEFANYVYEFQDIKPGSNCKPAIYDLDGDGLSDLIIGEKNDNTNPVTGEFGGLNFYKNIGSVGNPEFNSDPTVGGNTNTLGNVYTRAINTTSGSSAPSFFVSNDELYLAVGSRGGDIHIYNDIEDNLYESFNEEYESLPILDSGVRTSTTFADIDDDNYYEVITGNDNGGLRAFNTPFVVSDESNTDNIERKINFTLSPNPASSIIDVTMDNSTSAIYTIYNTNGRIVLKGKFDANYTRISIDELINGVYLFEISDGQHTVVDRFVKM